MRRKDGPNVWVERAVKVFRTRHHKQSQQLTTGTEETNGTRNSISDSLAPRGEEQVQEDIELLFTTRSITPTLYLLSPGFNVP